MSHRVRWLAAAVLLLALVAAGWFGWRAWQGRQSAEPAAVVQELPDDVADAETVQTVRMDAPTVVTAGTTPMALRRDALATLSLCLAAMTGMVSDLAPDTERMEAAAGSGFATATDLADWLVREKGLPFREAHHVTGALVARAESQGLDLPDLPLTEMQAVHAGIDEGVLGVLGVDNSVRSRTSYGGTAPVRVREQIARWKDALA